MVDMGDDRDVANVHLMQNLTRTQRGRRASGTVGYFGGAQIANLAANGKRRDVGQAVEAAAG
jgi:hypothetical protein